MIYSTAFKCFCQRQVLALLIFAPFGLFAQTNFVSNPSFNNPTPSYLGGGLKNTQEMVTLQNNFSTFPVKFAEVTPELMELTPEAFQSNPDFGILPENVPCYDCIELIHKRTLSSRYYIKKGSGGKEFYIQQCQGNFNYEDANGMIVAVDARLTPTSVPGIYSALNQLEPKTVNMTDGTSRIHFVGLDLTFNRNTSLLYLENGVETSLAGTLDLSASTVGSNGAYSQNVWAGIDREVISDQFGIETNFIFHSLPALPASTGWLAIGDEIELPAGYTIVRDSSSSDVSTVTTPENYWQGPLSIVDASGVEKARWETIYIYDSSTDRGTGVTPGAYQVLEPIPGKFLIRALVKADWMADPARVFPITFDPSVTSAAATFPTAIGFSIYAPGNGFCGSSSAFCLGGPLNVTFPGGATATSATWSLNYRAFNPAWQSDGGFRMVGPCGEDPANTNNWYSCAANAAGVCSGTGFVAPQLVNCLVPSCSATTIPFRVKNIDCFGWAGGCSVTYLRTVANTWTVTVQGNTLETLGNTATGNGSQTIAPATCSGNTTLDPTALYGVPAYSYVWSTGATTSTITIPSASGTSFSVTVTDACGVARVATFTITCPLGAEYAYFKTEKMDRDVLISWKTLYETNVDHFRVEHSLDAADFTAIASVTAIGSGSNSYAVTDKNMLPGTVYYRIISVDKNGSEEYSQILSVSDNEVKGLSVVPNPTNGYFNAITEVPSTDVYELEIIDESGKSVMKKMLSLERGLIQIPFHLVSESGVYTLIIKEGNYRETVRFVLKN